MNTRQQSLLPRARDYRGLSRSWRHDVLAGVTVGIVALPLALAFGVSSGVGAAAGIITAIVAGVVAAVFGGSNVQVSGPTGAMVVVLAPIVAQHGVAAVATVAVMAGLLVLLAGVLRLGRAISYLPWPVIEGFTAGIGIIIFLQQLPQALGVSLSGGPSNPVLAGWRLLEIARWPSALLPLSVVLVVVAIMVVVTRWLPTVPGSFLAIVVVSVVTAVTGLPLATIGELPHTLPMPSLPSFELASLMGLAGPAAAVAALAAIESLLSARVAASLSNTGLLHADRELVGQGLASIAAGVFGGMPATGAIARTAVNARSGAKTRLAAITHALLLAMVVFVAAGIVAHIPLAALAGVLMVTAARMMSIRAFRLVARSGRSSAAVFLVTALVTVVFDLVVAVGIGVAAAAFFALRALSRSSQVHREPLPGTGVAGDSRIALFRIDGSLFFGAAEPLLDAIAAAADVELVIIRLSQLRLVDATGAKALGELVHALERRGVTVLLQGVRSEHRVLLDRLGVVGALRRPHHLFDSLDAAIAYARARVAAVNGISAPGRR